MCRVRAALVIGSREKEFISEWKKVSLIAFHHSSDLFLCVTQLP